MTAGSTAPQLEALMDSWRAHMRMVESTHLAGALAAGAADELLDIRGVDASFVLTEMGEQINISARSLGDINVQSLMEKLGGGGHFTSAAAQPDMDFDEASEELHKIVRESLEKLPEIDDERKIDAINRRDTIF